MTKQMRFNAYLVLFTFSLVLLGANEALSEEKERPVEIKKERIVVAEINGEPIYKDDVIPYIEQQLKQYKIENNKESKEGIINKIYESKLEKLIDHKLLVQASQRLKIKDIDKKIDEEIERLKKRYPSEELFNKYVMKNHNTEEGLKNFLAQDITLRKYLNDKGLLTPKVPEEDIRQLYESRKPSFISDESINAGHIAILVDEEATPEEIKEAEEKANKVMKELKSGADFKAMAEKYSEDRFAEKGGDLGYIPKGYLPLEAEKVAFSMKAGEVSDVIKSSIGYQIVKVYEKVPEQQLPLEKVRDFITRYLQPRLSKELLASHISKLREKAKIKIYRENFIL